MMITQSGQRMMLFVQQRLYEGLQPDEDGYYTIQRKEFIDRIPIKPSTFSARINELVESYMEEWDLEIMFKLKGLIGENLYVDISYKNGKLRFRKNPYLERPELNYVWARKPLHWEERLLRREYIPVPENVVLPIQKDILK